MFCTKYTNIFYHNDNDKNGMVHLIIQVLLAEEEKFFFQLVVHLQIMLLRLVFIFRFLSHCGALSHPKIKLLPIEADFNFMFTV